MPIALEILKWICVVVTLILSFVSCYDLGRKRGRKDCKKEFEEIFDWEWVDVDE